MDRKTIKKFVKLQFTSIYLSFTVLKSDYIHSCKCCEKSLNSHSLPSAKAFPRWTNPQILTQAVTFYRLPSLTILIAQQKGHTRKRTSHINSEITSPVIQSLFINARQLLIFQSSSAPKSSHCQRFISVEYFYSTPRKPFFFFLLLHFLFIDFLNSIS